MDAALYTLRACSDKAKSYHNDSTGGCDIPLCTSNETQVGRGVNGPSDFVLPIDWVQISTRHCRLYYESVSLNFLPCIFGMSSGHSPPPHAAPSSLPSLFLNLLLSLSLFPSFTPHTTGPMVCCRQLHQRNIHQQQKMHQKSTHSPHCRRSSPPQRRCSCSSWQPGFHSFGVHPHEPCGTTSTPFSRTSQY